MSGYYTTMGGSDPRFPLTRWSLVARAKASRVEDRVTALNELARAYWRPLYCFLAASGKRNEDAKDLVQGFFGSFLERDVIASFDPTKGKFRSFLLACLKGYVGHQVERTRALKRGGGKARLSLDDLAEKDAYDPPAKGETPEALYDRAWALSMLDRAVERVREELKKKGKEQHVVVLEGYLASDNLARPGYAELAAKSGLSENRVRHLLHEFRGRLREAMLDEIRTQTANEEDAKEELKRLFECLGRK